MAKNRRRLVYASLSLVVGLTFTLGLLVGTGAAVSAPFSAVLVFQDDIASQGDAISTAGDVSSVVLELDVLTGDYQVTVMAGLQKAAAKDFESMMKGSRQSSKILP